MRGVLNAKIFHGASRGMVCSSLVLTGAGCGAPRRNISRPLAGEKAKNKNPGGRVRVPARGRRENF